MSAKPESLTFQEFYKTYQQLHQTPICRGLHVVGVVLGAALLAYSVLWLDVWMFLAVPLVGYSLAWIGHFVFEGNRPATWGHPYYSFKADLYMTWEILNGRESLNGKSIVEPSPVQLEAIPVPAALEAEAIPVVLANPSEAASAAH